MLRQDRVLKIGPVKAADKTLGIAQLEKTLDVVANAMRCGRREREHRNFGMESAKRRDPAILRPEIVSPFADAVGFVDRDAEKVPSLQTGEKAGKNEAFRRDVQQAVFAAIEPVEPLGGGRRIDRAVQKRRANPVRLERVDLILHQRDQRRHDERKPVFENRRQLITQRFSAARRQSASASRPAKVASAISRCSGRNV